MLPLNSTFAKDDLNFLIQTVDDWESQGAREYAMMLYVKNMPLPPEDNEMFDFIKGLKDQFLRQEKEIVRIKDEKQEKAVFLKAKLFLARKDVEINQVFDFANHMNDESVQVPCQPDDNAQKKFDLAEKFIDEMGVRDYYEKFLAENK